MKYILKDKIPVPCEDLMEWANWIETENKRVDYTELSNGVYVSTVFLGISYSFNGEEPLLFETMVMGGELNYEMERCSTWKQAEFQHFRMVERVLALQSKKN